MLFELRRGAPLGVVVGEQQLGGLELLPLDQPNVLVDFRALSEGVVVDPVADEQHFAMVSSGRFLDVEDVFVYEEIAQVPPVRIFAPYCRDAFLDLFCAGRGIGFVPGWWVGIDRRRHTPRLVPPTHRPGLRIHYV